MIGGEPIGEWFGYVVLTSLVVNSVVGLLLGGFTFMTILAKDSVALGARIMAIGYLVGSCAGWCLTAFVLGTPWREAITLWAPAFLSGPLGLISAAFLSRLGPQHP
jgi:hypothetical protein